MAKTQAAPLRNHWPARITLLLAVLILIPSGYGFVGKFIELINVFRGEPDGAFAVAPMANYLLASAGFLFMLLWAASRGMFHDVERPKREFLEREELLDEGLSVPCMPAPASRSRHSSKA